MNCVHTLFFFKKIVFLWYFVTFFTTVVIAAQEEEATKASNFLRRSKPSRNYRTKPTQRTTPASISKEDSEIETSAQCPEPDGFFADAEQCDKYYACR